jgi:multidrug efflux pump
MKFLDFFIDRPVTATVINLMLMVCGVLAFRGLLVDEYPVIVVPRLSVSTHFPNASAETVEKEITSPIEEALAMVEGLEKISSQSSRERSSIDLTFSSKVPFDRAVAQVNEQLSRVRGRLPTEALASEISRGGQNDNAIVYLWVKSPTLKGAALTHFTNTNIKSHLQGIDGVARAEVWGRPYAMNLALDRAAMHSQNISPHQIVAVLKQNELLLSAGQLRTKEPINLDVVPKNAEDYEQMVVGKNGDTPVLLGDVADVFLDEDERGIMTNVAGEQAVLLAVYKASDGNILDIAEAIKRTIPKINEEVRGLAEVKIESDRSIFVRESLKTIYQTVAEACILVLLIILLFLRNVRATLVPLVTIPISLVATFFALRIFGLSINTITLLAMVLAVGLVVDDAIVVLENIFRYREMGLSAYDAAKKGAREIGFAIVAMTGTLISVFLPLVFVTDITGMILREFAITLACAVLFSGIVALTLSPLMCAHLLKRAPRENRLSRAIERGITSTEEFYHQTLIRSLRFRYPIFGGVALLLVAGFFVGKRLQSDLVPKEDRGIIGAHMPMVQGLDLEDMEPYVAQVEAVFLAQPETAQMLTISGTWGVQIVAPLKNWRERKVHAEKLLARIREQISHIPTVDIYPWNWDLGLEALRGSGGGNSQIAVSLKSAKSFDELEKASQAFLDRLKLDGVIIEAQKDLNMNQKFLDIKLERDAMAALGIEEKAVSSALQTYSDRMAPSEFKLDGQRYKVHMLSTDPMSDLEGIYLGTKFGDQVPLSTFATVTQEVGAPSLSHLDQMRSVIVSGNLGVGKSLSEAKVYLDKVIAEIMPPDVAVSYEGALAMQKSSDQTFFLLFIAGLIFIFAILAIQFEAILDPLIILITVPMACIGAIFLLWAMQNGTNLYTQVGMLTLIGLITKHGILLTEFVAHERREGRALYEAVIQAATLRFRPIVMTTAATVLGALPLITTRGAGVEARASIGIVIVGGMIFGTMLTLFVLPGVILSVHSLKDHLVKKMGGTLLAKASPEI